MLDVDPQARSTPSSARRRAPRRSDPRPPRGHRGEGVAWVEVGGISSRWWVARTPVAPVAAPATIASTRRSRAGRSSPAAGSSNRRSSCLPYSARAISTRWRSPSEHDSSGRSANALAADRREQPSRIREVIVIERLPPRDERCLAPGADGLEDRASPREALRQPVRHVSDPPSKGADIGPAEPFAEDFHGAGGGLPPRPHQRQRRRLAAAVGTEHHPLFARADRQIDRPEDRPAADAHLGAGQHDRIGHRIARS